MPQRIPEDARCLDCRYPLRDLTASTCPECGRAFERGNSATYHRFTYLPIALKYWAKPPSLWTIGACSLLAIFVIYYASEMGWYNWQSLREVHRNVGAAIVMIAALDSIIRIIAAHRDRKHASDTRTIRSKRGRWRWFAFPACILVIASLNFYNWPLKIRFELSRAAFEREIELMRGPRRAVPMYRSVGLFPWIAPELTDDNWSSVERNMPDGPNAWFFNGVIYINLTGLHYCKGVSFLFREADGPPPDWAPGDGEYHPELADPPWFIYY